MKSLQICLLSALLAIAASNPIPADEPAVPTVTPAVPDVTPAVKSVPEQPVVPAVAATELPSTQKSLPIDNERIPEPQALPSKKEEAPAKAEEKKREVTVEQPTAAPVEPQPDQVTGKSLPAQPAKDVVVEASTPKVEALAAESAVKSVTVEQPADAVPTVPAVAVVPEAKQAVDVTKAVESTVVPSAIASEKKIDAGWSLISFIVTFKFHFFNSIQIKFPKFSYLNKIFQIFQMIHFDAFFSLVCIEQRPQYQLYLKMFSQQSKVFNQNKNQLCQ